MLPVGANYGKDIKCFACQISRDTSEHLLECVVVKMKCPEIMENTDSVFEDIFSSNMEKVLKIAKLLRSSIRIREILKSNL